MKMPRKLKRVKMWQKRAKMWEFRWNVEPKQFN